MKGMFSVQVSATVRKIGIDFFVNFDERSYLVSI